MRKIGSIVSALTLVLVPSFALAQSACLTLSHNFGPNDTDSTTGGEVTLLQRHLAADPSLYPEGLITGFYGNATTRAVQRYQAKYGIVSSGTPDTTGYGYIGPKTREAFATKCSGSTTPSGFSISLASTPVQTMPVNTSATWILRTTGGSSPYSYVADWGDGQVSSLQSSTIFQHSYLSSGIFTPTFAARDGAGRTTRVSAPPVTIGNQAPSTSCTITAANTSITKGQGTTITWNAPGTSGGTISGLGSVGASGSLTVVPAQTTTYTGSFIGTGSSATCSVTVNVTTPTTTTTPTATTTTTTTPTPTLSATPLNGKSPLSVKLTITNGMSCTPYQLSWGDGTDSDYAGPSSSCTPTAHTGYQTHSYTNPGTYIIVFTQGTHIVQSSVINVTAPDTVANAPTCTLTASKKSIAPGENITLTWTSTNATNATMPQVGTINLNGSKSFTPTNSTQYTASFFGAGGSITCDVTVIVSEFSGMLCGARDLRCSPLSIGQTEGENISYGDEMGIASSYTNFPGVQTRTRNGKTYSYAVDFGVNVPCEGQEITVKKCDPGATFGQLGTNRNSIQVKDIVCPSGYAGALIASYVSDPGTPPSYSLTSPGPESPVSLISSGGTPPKWTYLVTCAKGWIPSKSPVDCSVYDFSTPATRALGCN